MEKLKPKTTRKYYDPRNLRIADVITVLNAYQISPADRLVKLALEAERQGKLELASLNWRDLLTYTQARLKPIDPVEQWHKERQIATLEEIAKLKHAILAGAVAAIDESTVIENETADSLAEFI